MEDTSIAFAQVTPEKRREDLLRYAGELRKLADELERGNNASLIVAAADAAGTPTTMVLGPRVVNLGLLKHLDNTYAKPPRERAALELYEEIEYEASMASEDKPNHPDDWELAVPIEESTEADRVKQREKVAEYLNRFAELVASGEIVGLVMEAADAYGEVVSLRHGPTVLAYGLVEALRAEAQ